MAKSQSLFTFLLTILCACSVIRQYQVLEDYWNQTFQDVMTAYDEALSQCEMDQRDICESSVPPELEKIWTVSLDSPSGVHNAADKMDDMIQQYQKQQQDEKPVSLEPVPSTPETISRDYHLRAATSRRLSNEAFPSPCLQNAWIEQKVHSTCSRALHHYQELVTLQQHQTCTAQVFQMVFGIFWVVLLLVWCIMYWIFQTSDWQQIQVLLLNHHQQQESCCCCCCGEQPEEECCCRRKSDVQK